MKLLICYLFLSVIMHLACYVRGDCCYWTRIRFQRNSILDNCEDFGAKRWKHSRDCRLSICGDGKPLAADKYFCGVGDCNAAGCDCDGGCIPGEAKRKFKQIHGERVTLVKTGYLFGSNE